ncbi:MAG: hypothetical protein ACREUM_02865, partial [Nitrosospira sp.]
VTFSLRFFKSDRLLAARCKSGRSAQPGEGDWNGQDLNSYNRNSSFWAILVPFSLLPVFTIRGAVLEKAILEKYGFLCRPARGPDN